MTDNTKTKDEHARLHESARKTLQAVHDINTEKSELAGHMKQLRRKSEALEQRWVMQENAASESLQKFAQVDCRKLCDTVHATLPREIRDSVYSYIHPEQEGKVYAHYVNPLLANKVKKSYFESDSEAHWRLDNTSNERNHLWSPESLGIKVFTELLQQYFKSTLFKFGREYNLVYRFQVTDQWKLGMAPIEFVTNVEVEVLCDDNDHDVPWSRDICRNRKCSYRCFEWDDDYDGCSHSLPPSPAPRVAILSKLQTLFGFKQGTKINIKLNTSNLPGEIVEDLAHVQEKMIPIILPTLRRLGQAGYKVKIAVVRAGNIWPESGYEYVMDGGLPTPEAWNKKFQELKAFEVKKVEELSERENRLDAEEDEEDELEAGDEENEEEGDAENNAHVVDWSSGASPGSPGGGGWDNGGQDEAADRTLFADAWGSS